MLISQAFMFAFKLRKKKKPYCDKCLKTKFVVHFHLFSIFFEIIVKKKESFLRTLLINQAYLKIITLYFEEF